MESPKPMRDRALVVMLYLTGARISEVVRKITPIQIEVQNFHDSDFMVISNVECLKRRKNNIAKRNIAININREGEFLVYLRYYMDRSADDEPLFNISRQHAYTIIRCLRDDFFPHYLRHLRCSHLSSLYGFNSAELRQYFGWSDDKPAATYTHLNWRDSARKMV